MLLLAVLIIAFIGFTLGLGHLAVHRKSLRLKCVCRFKSETPEQDVGFIQELLHQNRRIDVSRLTRKLEAGAMVFEIEYTTDRATQARVLGQLRGRDSLQALRILSGSDRHSNVVFTSKELSLTKGLRKEIRVPRKEAKYAPKRRRN